MSTSAIDAKPTESSLLACLSENSTKLVNLLELMKLFAATDLLRISRDLNNNASLVFESRAGAGYRMAAVDGLIETIEQCRGMAELNDLPMTALHAGQLIPSLISARERLDTDQAQRVATMLCITLENELSLRLFLAIPAASKESFDSPQKGWEIVIERFPDSVSDIEEMNRCFALARYNAAVFHSVQAIEYGLIGVGVWLGIADPLSGWTAVSNELKKIANKRYADRSAFERAHCNFIEQLQGTVEALKNAWRNKVSHATGRIKIGSEFMPDVAEEIIMASRGLMRRLSTDLPRVGQLNNEELPQ